MIGPVFVDTNVLVYRYDMAEPAKRARALNWVTSLWESRTGRLSYQVLQELYEVLTRKLRTAVPASEAQHIVRNLATWNPVAPDLATLERAWLVQTRLSVSWWDALIIAAAQTCECQVLLTEDLQHGQAIGPLRIINPFETPELTPAEVLQGWEP